MLTFPIITLSQDMGQQQSTGQTFEQKNTTNSNDNMSNIYPHFRFMDLPVELRESIIDSYFETPTKITFIPNRDPKNHNNALEMRPETSLRLVNRYFADLTLRAIERSPPTELRIDIRASNAQINHMQERNMFHTFVRNARLLQVHSSAIEHGFEQFIQWLPRLETIRLDIPGHICDTNLFPLPIILDTPLDQIISDATNAGIRARIRRVFEFTTFSASDPDWGMKHLTVTINLKFRIKRNWVGQRYWLDIVPPTASTAWYLVLDVEYTATETRITKKSFEEISGRTGHAHEREEVHNRLEGTMESIAFLSTDQP